VEYLLEVVVAELLMVQVVQVAPEVVAQGVEIILLLVVLQLLILVAGVAQADILPQVHQLVVTVDQE
jgi:hypothetical protein